MLTLKLIFYLSILAVNSHESCTSSSSCEALNTCKNDECVHKSLFPLALTEYIGTGVMVVISCIANAGGIGGSTITISLMLLLFKFNAHAAVALTQVFIFAGTFTATALKFKDRHPTKDRPLIYYDVLMIIVGPILLGVSIGVMINPMFPEWLILGLLTLLVIFLLWDIVKRVKKIRAKEREFIRSSLPPGQEDLGQEYEKSVITSFLYSVLSQNTVKIDTDRNTESLLQSKLLPAHEYYKSINTIKELEDTDTKTSNENSVYEIKVNSIYKDEKRLISLIPLVYFIFMSGLSVLFSLLKGSSSTPSFIGIDSCSLEHFSLTIGYYIAMICSMFLSSYYLVNKTRVCELGGYDFDEFDIRWNGRKCAIVSMFSVITGIVAGLLGMGGGNIIGPMLLTLGVRPEISTISSTFSIFLSSGAAAAQFFIAGVIPFDYAIWFFAISTIGSVCGILVLRRVALKRNKISFLVMCVGIILFLSLLIIPTVGILKAIDQNSKGVFQVGFSPMC